MYTGTSLLMVTTYTDFSLKTTALVEWMGTPFS